MSRRLSHLFQSKSARSSKSSSDTTQPRHHRPNVPLSSKPVTTSNPHTTPPTGYPRPDFRRRNQVWESLNGPWDFLFDDYDVGLDDSWQHSGISVQPAKRTIQVPYVFQSAASSIHERGVHEVLWYERRIEDIRSAEHKQQGDRLILRFGAVDYEARVWLDGQYVGSHSGGHVPFDLDLSEAIAYNASNDTHRLTIRVYDSALDLAQPRGKQFWGPESRDIFYTPSSGIWQTVWLEVVPRLHIADSRHGTIISSNNLIRGALDTTVAVQGRRAQQTCSVELEARMAGLLVSRSERKQLSREENYVHFDHNMRLNLKQLQDLPAEFTRDIAPLANPFCWRNGIALWSPEHPILYDLTIRLYSADSVLLDEVQTKVGMRSLDWTHGDGTFRLNGRPYFQALLLDQGLWPNTLLTPPNQDALRTDILLSKSLGFNGCRKHQKVEDPVFLHLADTMGFLVWGEMASCHTFSLTATQRFEKEWMEMVKRDINHPCVVTWTPANESWGYNDLGRNVRQRDHIRSLYFQTKLLDPTRPINDNDGWEHVVTDISSFHDYADAHGMAERCRSLHDVLTRGRNMFLGPIHSEGQADASGKHDAGSQHVRGAPVMCTEFGGVNVAARNDESRSTNWGYTTAASSADLLKRFEDLMMAVVREGHICCVVWTQFSDIEQEANGLVTYDRQPKLDVEGARKVMEKVKAMYYSRLR